MERKSKKGKNRTGFTLIELMLVSAIISVLAVIAIPKFGDLIIKAKEAAIKGKLGSLRSAISIYYSNCEGMYPHYSHDQDRILDGLTINSLYIDEIPEIQIPTVLAETPWTKHKGKYTESLALVESDFMSGMWGYRAWFYPNPGNPNGRHGTLVVNCTHPDSSGRVWSTW